MLVYNYEEVNHLFINFNIDTERLKCEIFPQQCGSEDKKLQNPLEPTHCIPSDSTIINMLHIDTSKFVVSC